MSARAKGKTKTKTHKGASKRFRLTAKGKVKRAKVNLGHILSKKTRARKRRLRALTLVHSADEKRIKTMLPYA